MSAPCRAVIFTAKALGIEMNMKYLNLLKGHHKTESFAKVNSDKKRLLYALIT